MTPEGDPRPAPGRISLAPMKAETAISCLVLLLGLAGLACSPVAEPPAQESEIVRQGRQIFQSDACPTCHGRDRTGTNNGPSLQGLRSRWNEEDLIRFLRDPRSSNTPTRG